MKALTMSMQNYINVIYGLSSHTEGVRVSDIAAELNVAKSSVCTAMSKLQDNGLIHRDDKRLVFLTKDGEYQEILALDKVSIIRKFLTDVLGVKHEIADTDVCAIEHVISVETLCSLCRFTNRKCTGGCYAKKDTAPTKVKTTM